MKVYFLKHVINVAKEGEVKEVSSGYASNYLFPKGLAKPYTQSLEKKIQQQKKKKEQERRYLLGEKGEILEKLEGITLTFQMPATPSGKIYGSVSEKEIANEINKKFHMPLTKKHIKIPMDQLKHVGEGFVFVDLGENKSEKIHVVIEPKND